MTVPKQITTLVINFQHAEKRQEGVPILILSRRPDEAIIIGDNEIIVRVLSISGKQVRIGITADESITVHREEIAERIRAGETPEPVEAITQVAEG